MQTEGRETCFIPAALKIWNEIKLLLEEEHTHIHVQPRKCFHWCAGGRQIKCHICHFHTVTVFIASTYSLTLTHLSYGETFLWQSAWYSGARSCCSSAIRFRSLKLPLTMQIPNLKASELNWTLVLIHFLPGIFFFLSLSPYDTNTFPCWCFQL